MKPARSRRRRKYFWGLSHPRKAYIAHNMGLEGWCVLTTKLHNLVRVLKGNNINSDFVHVARTRSIESYEDRKGWNHCGVLVPRMKPTQYLDTVPPLYSANCLRQGRFWWPMDFIDSMRPSVLSHKIQLHLKTDYCVMLRFDSVSRKYKAF